MIVGSGFHRTNLLDIVTITVSFDIAVTLPISICIIAIDIVVMIFLSEMRRLERERKSVVVVVVDQIITTIWVVCGRSKIPCSGCWICGRSFILRINGVIGMK